MYNGAELSKQKYKSPKPQITKTKKLQKSNT